MTEKRTVLVVEDEGMIREVIAFHLFDAGLYVFEASDGDEALAIFKEQNIDVVVTDIKMPRFNGYQLIKSILHEKIVPIIVITGYVDPPIWVLRNEGVVKVLKKPINMNHLIDLAINPLLIEDQRPDSMKVIQLAASLDGGNDTPFIKVGRHGFYLCCDTKGYKIDEDIHFQLHIQDRNVSLSGWGRIIFINDESNEAVQENQGLMIQIMVLDTSKSEFQDLIPADEKFRSIPLISSTLSGGAKNAV